MTIDPAELAERRINEALHHHADTLDLSGLGLRQLPRSLFRLTDLHELYINDNPLGALTRDLDGLERLEVLEARNCALTSYSLEFPRLPALRKLALSGNKLRSLLVSSPGIEELLVADNDLATLRVQRLTALRILDVSSNRLNSLGDLPCDLEALNIANNNGFHWPPNLRELQRLRYLQASSCTGLIKSSSLSHLRELRHLHVLATPMHLDGDTMVAFTELRTLYLSGCMLDRFPYDLEHTRELRSIDLSNNRISRVPDALFDLPRLMSVNLCGNRLTRLPDQICKLGALERLLVNKTALDELPASIGELRRLRELHAAQNDLRKLPESIWRLDALEELVLDDCPLRSLSGRISQLRDLQRLSIDNAELEALPQEIVELGSLRALSAAGNKLSHFPTVPAGKLGALQLLSLSDNRLTELTPSIRHLAALSRLDLEGNQLPALPDVFDDLHALRDLDVERNRLEGLPPSLNAAVGLRRLGLDGNDALRLPTEVLARPSSMTPDEHARSLLDYYWGTRVPQRRLNEAKLILVGRGDVGKTSLVRRMIEDRFDAHSAKTEGIQIQRWMLRVHEDLIRVHVWDFGGQEIMHATHQFFLTERSVYLLVLNGREGGEDLDAVYWLKLIASLGTDSPVLIVLNKIGQHPFDLNRRGLRQSFPSIVGFIETDCSDGRGITELRHRIISALDSMPDVTREIPARWFEVKDRLSALKQNYIPLAEYRALCDGLGVTHPDEQDALAQLLHRLGVVLHYRSDPRLRDTNVLNPHWVTTAIYKILNDPALAQALGELRSDNLARILPAAAYPPERHGFILELMHRFQLCFAYPDGSGPPRYLIPELLGKDEPDLREEFAPERCTCFEYCYGVLPEGLVARFIVRTHVLSQDTRRWRTGAVLKRGECSALIKTDIEARKVQIRVQGPAVAGLRRELLAIIRFDFDRIHSQLPGLEVTEWIPLPGHPTHSVPYAEVLALARSGETTITRLIDNMLIKQDVRELLHGIDMPHQYPDQATPAPPLRAFLSYSHKDEPLRDELETHLKLMQRQGLLQTWTDRRILPGDGWKRAIDDNIRRADIILLLISADFLASDYCYDTELKIALDRHQRGETVLVPIFVRACEWSGAPFGAVQGLPRDAKPVTAWSDRDAAWTDVAQGLRRLLEQLRSRANL